jgi:hypothetical protein
MLILPVMLRSSLSRELSPSAMKSRISPTSTESKSFRREDRATASMAAALRSFGQSFANSSGEPYVSALLISPFMA